MQNYNPELLRKIKKFREEIYFYCDHNINSKNLFPLFVNLWPENGEKVPDLQKRDLVNLTSEIIGELIDKNILRVINKNGTPHTENQSVYAFYKVLPHDYLLNHNKFVDKGRELMFK
jgi:hypothetical protein